MPTITQTANADSIWNGTVPTSDPGVTGVTAYRLYMCPHANLNPNNFKFVKSFSNPHPTDPLVLGPLTYPEMFIDIQVKKFFLKVVEMRGNQQGDLADNVTNPALEVAASAIRGWSLEQLLTMGVNPVVIVGRDDASGLFYPVNVVAGTGSGFKLEP